MIKYRNDVVITFERLYVVMAVFLMGASAVWAQQVRQYNVKEKGMSFGGTLAVDCSGNMYCTSGSLSSMYVWRQYPAGTVTVVPTIDSAGTAVAINEISWDAERGLLWGACCWPSFGDGVGIYTVSAGGLCTFQFSIKDPSWPFGGADGLAYDPDPAWPGGSLWLSWDQNNYALHYSTSGDSIERVELPMEGSNPNNISGICATPYGLWCARIGVDYHCITLHSKRGGPPIPGLTIDTSPLYMLEGLECESNPAGFPAGTCLLWVKDVSSPESVTAYKIESGSCTCPGKPTR